MHVDSCSIYLYDRTGEKLVLAASTGLNQAGINKYWLPHGAGLWAFSTLDEAAAAVDRINGDYLQQARAARALAEEYFEAGRVAGKLLHGLGLE